MSENMIRSSASVRNSVNLSPTLFFIVLDHLFLGILLQVPSEIGDNGTAASANPTLGVKLMKNLAGGGKDRERPREKVEKRLTEVWLVVS